MRPIERHAKWALNATRAAIVAEVVYMGVGLMFLLDLQRLASGTQGNLDDAAFDLSFRYDPWIIGYSIVVIGAYIVNAFWIHRATSNAADMHPYDGRFGPGWAIGFHCIPILNLWKPYVSARQTWNTSTRIDRDPEAAAPGFLKLWWALWVTLSILSIISGQYFETFTYEGFRASAIIDILNGPVSLGCAILFYRFVRDVTQAQQSSGIEKVFA